MTEKTMTESPTTPLATTAHLVALDVDRTLAQEGFIPDVTVAAVRVASEPTVVVGDGHDDLSMFEWAARAVAMEDAPAEVQAAAGEVCGSITEHGVVDVPRSMASVR